MQTNTDPKDTTGFSFQVDLLNLNLQLSSTETATQPQTREHEAAIAQMRTLAGRA